MRRRADGIGQAGAFSSLRVGLPVTGHATLDQLRRTIPWRAVQRHLALDLRRAVLESIEDARDAIAARRVFPPGTAPG